MLQQQQINGWGMLQFLGRQQASLWLGATPKLSIAAYTIQASGFEDIKSVWASKERHAADGTKNTEHTVYLLCMGSVMAVKQCSIFQTLGAS